MSGHNRWSQIKRKKEKSDNQKSKIFSKFSKLISQEAKTGGLDSPTLKKAIERAKEANMPNGNIERALKKATEKGVKKMESIFYETYGPGGIAIIIETLTDNKNKASQEVKSVLAKNNLSLSTVGSAQFAFTKKDHNFTPNFKVNLSDEDLNKLLKIIETLEECEEIQEIFTNAE